MRGLFLYRNCPPCKFISSPHHLVDFQKIDYSEYRSSIIWTTILKNMKGLKPKKQKSQMLRGLLTVLAIVVLAAAAFFVSNKLSSQGQVAPNAPESNPMAASCDSTTFGKCGVAGGCSVGSKCTRMGAGEYACRSDVTCAKLKCGDPGTSGNCGSVGGCSVGSRCNRVGGPDDFECISDNACSGGGSSSSGGGSSSSGGGGGGGGTQGNCSNASAASCQGKRDGATCNGGVCNATGQKGNDGKLKCACDVGKRVRPTCAQYGMISNGKCEAGLRPITPSNCCVKK